jgi:hypothetical protein
MNFWSRAGGILLGAISLFSLVQKLYGFGLASVIKDMVAFYRALFHPIANVILDGLGWLVHLVGWTLPHIPADPVVIWVLMGATLIRAAIRTSYGDGAVPLDMALLYPIALAIWPWYMVVLIKEIDENSDDDYLLYWLEHICIVVIVFFIIFGTNAYFSP